MIKPILLDKNTIIMSKHMATGIHPGNGEKVKVFFGLNTGMPVIHYKGRVAVYDIKGFIKQAIELIDEAEEE